jgi:hypothetical protein
MSDKEGFLKQLPSGRWAVVRSGREPVAINSSELFRVEVDGGELKPTRMEYEHHDRGGGEYYSVDGYELRDGMRAAIGSGE